LLPERSCGDQRMGGEAHEEGGYSEGPTWWAGSPCGKDAASFIKLSAHSLQPKKAST